MHDKVLQIYQLRYPQYNIWLYIDQDDKHLLIDKGKEEKKLTEDEIKSRDAAHQALEKLREFLEKFRSSEAFASAVFEQCVHDIKEGKSRQQFLSNVAEYYFGNIWQEGERLYSQDNYLLRIFQLAITKLSIEDAQILAEHILKGLYNKTVNQMFVKGLNFTDG